MDPVEWSTTLIMGTYGVAGAGHQWYNRSVLEDALQRSSIQGSDQADVDGLTEEITVQQAVGVPLRQQGHLPWRVSGCLFCLDCSKERAPAIDAEATGSRAEKADTETTRHTYGKPRRRDQDDGSQGAYQAIQRRGA
jgi:hypothetical protein